jgi:hypothetical protein
MNTKKCTSLFLAFLLLVSNIGFAYTVHYCGGEIASVTLKTKETAIISEKGCCEKIIAKKDSCCKDKVFRFEKKSENVTLKAFSFEPYIAFAIQKWQPITIDLITNFKKNQIISYYCDAHAPPLFKLYNQYIYYA